MQVASSVWFKLNHLIQAMKSISGSVVPLAMFDKGIICPLTDTEWQKSDNCKLVKHLSSIMSNVRRSDHQMSDYLRRVDWSTVGVVIQLQASLTGHLWSNRSRRPTFTWAKTPPAPCPPPHTYSSRSMKHFFPVDKKLLKIEFVFES